MTGTKRNSALLTEAWLGKSLKDSDWRFKLLSGILEFTAARIQGTSQCESTSLILFSEKIDKSELKIFLKAIGDITFKHPRMRLEDEDKLLYMLYCD